MLCQGIPSRRIDLMCLQYVSRSKCGGGHPGSFRMCATCELLAYGVSFFEFYASSESVSRIRTLFLYPGTRVKGRVKLPHAKSG